MIKAGLEKACFTTHVKLRTLPDSMKTLELPKMDAIGSEKQKSRLISKYVNILFPEISNF